MTLDKVVAQHVRCWFSMLEENAVQASGPQTLLALSLIGHFRLPALVTRVLALLPASQDQGTDIHAPVQRPIS